MQHMHRYDAHVLHLSLQRCVFDMHVHMHSLTYAQCQDQTRTVATYERADDWLLAYHIDGEENRIHFTRWIVTLR